MLKAEQVPERIMRKDKDNSMKNKATDKLNIIPLKEIGACEGHLWGVMSGLRKSNLGDAT